MINLPVSEAYAFDYAAILEVKNDAGLNVHTDLHLVVDALHAQLGSCSMVLLSDEYQALYKANREVFDLVELASKDKCLASEVDAANQRRYFAKRALQERFWPSKPLTEVKSDRS